jgi:hypothetical protein
VLVAGGGCAIGEGGREERPRQLRSSLRHLERIRADHSVYTRTTFITQRLQMFP